VIAALFVPSLGSGGIFLAGIAISNWRLAIVAVVAALLANALAVQAGATGGGVNFGFIGFNGVLAALAAYVLVAPDLRLVVLGSVLATWLASYVYRGAPVPVLASGFVLAVWAMLLLGWLNPRFAPKPTKLASS
jgi:urea transporter